MERLPAPPAPPPAPAAASSVAPAGRPGPPRARRAAGRRAARALLAPAAAFTALVALALAPHASAQEGGVEDGLWQERFDVAWRLVDERYWDLEGSGVDWDAARERWEPRALEAAAAGDEEGFYEALESMYSEIGDSHSVYVPPGAVEEFRATYGDLPCLGVFSQDPGGPREGRRGNVSWSRDGDIGVIVVPDLVSPGTASNLRSAVRELQAAGVEGLVLDLRDNPGGRLIEMMQAAGVFTRGFLWRALTNWTLPMPYPAIGAVETDLPLAVLVDGDVNSAAEGLAGALQRSGRAFVVGETSAGNVEAVLPFCLRDGSQAWIATGVLAPIGAPTWEGTGVVPDVATEPDAALEAALRELRDGRR